MFLPPSCQTGFQTHYKALRRRITFLLPWLLPSPRRVQALRGPGRLHFVLSGGRRTVNMEPRAGRAASAAVAPWAGRGPAHGAQGEAALREPRAPRAPPLTSCRRKTTPLPARPYRIPQPSARLTVPLTYETEGRRQLEPPGLLQKSSFSQKSWCLLRQCCCRYILLLSWGCHLLKFPMAAALNNQPFGVAVFLSKGSFWVELSCHAFLWAAWSAKCLSPNLHSAVAHPETTLSPGSRILDCLLKRESL